MQHGDFQTGTWKRLVKHLEDRLKDLRLQNDSTQLDERKTAVIRGRINEVKELLTLSTTGPATDGGPDPFDAADRS